MQLFLGSPFLFNFRHIVRVNRSKRHLGNTLIVMACISHLSFLVFISIFRVFITTRKPTTQVPATHTNSDLLQNDHAIAVRAKEMPIRTFTLKWESTCNSLRGNTAIPIERGLDAIPQLHVLYKNCLEEHHIHNHPRPSLYIVSVYAAKLGFHR